MDELLHEPRRLGEAGADLPLGKKLRGFAEALGFVQQFIHGWTPPLFVTDVLL